MTLTTKSARKPKASQGDDDKLVEVDVTPGRAVFWDGEQREGLLHGVPKHLAMQWLADGSASVVYEPTK